MILPPLPSLSQIQSQVSTLVGARDILHIQKDQITREISRLEDRSIHMDLVISLFQKLLDREIMESAKVVENILTEGLRTVFPDQDLRVVAEIELSRGKVSLNLKTQREYSDGTVIEGSSQDSFGGSVLTVQSVIMRVLVSLKHGLRPILLLDESLPAFDSNYVVNMSEFLKSLAKTMNLDILIVTHNPILAEASNLSYQVRNLDGSAKFIRLENENRRANTSKIKTSSLSAPQRATSE